MPNASIMFLLLALTAAVLGFGNSLGSGAGVAQLLFFLASVLFVGSMAWHRYRLD